MAHVVVCDNYFQCKKLWINQTIADTYVGHAASVTVTGLIRGHPSHRLPLDSSTVFS